MKATKKTGGPRFVAASIGKAALVAAAFCVATAPSPSFAEAKSATLRATGYSGSTTLTDFQALVKLSEGDDYGFSYNEAGGASHYIWFTSADGTTVYPHDIDKWNTSGDSFVWVRLPELKKGTTFKMHWSDSASDVQSASGNVWDGYVGVWHMNETGSNDETDSTAHGIDAKPVNESGTQASIDTDTNGGQVGNGRSVTQAKMFKVSNHANHISDAKVFTIGGWVKRTGSGGYPRIFAGNPNTSDRTKWEVFGQTDTELYARGGSTDLTGCSVDIRTSAGWKYLTVVFNGTAATVYCNGASVKSGKVGNSTQGNFFTFGGVGSRNDRSFVGTFDEVRMYNGVLSAERIAADYATMNAPTEFLVPASQLTATWTGAAGDGNPATASNWDYYEGSETPIAKVPDSETVVTIAGNSVNLQIPANSTFACKSFEIGNCTFTADCDWRGLSVKPTISGTADLAGHNLQLNDLAPGVGSSFANSSATASQVRLPVAIVNGAVTDEELANLSVASNVQIVMANSVNTTATANSRIGYVSGGTSSYVQTGGTFTSSGLALELGKKSGGTGLFRIEAGTAKISTIKAQSVAGANALVEIAGGELQSSRLELGNSSSGSAIVNQTGGKFNGARVKTGENNGNFYLGYSDNGTGVYNLTGGTLTTKGTQGGGLVLGYANGTTGRITVGGKGVVSTTDCWVGRQGEGYFTITNGGTVTVSGACTLGGNSTSGNGVGTVKLTGGTLNLGGQNATYPEISVGRYKTGTLDIGGDGVVNASRGVMLGREPTGNGTLKLSGNGVLNTSKIVKGNGTASVVIDGGTLVAKNASDGAFISNVSTLTVGAGTIDTDGHNVTVTADAVNLSESGGSFTKKGAGTLTFPAMPSTDALTVEAGTLALSLPAAVVNRARLAHRWSFNGSTEEENLADSVGGAVAGKIGDGVSFADGAVTLSGNGNSKGSLRLGAAGAALLGTGEGATVEIWATRNDVKNWARAFDYGNNQNWWWHLTWNNGTDGTKFEVGGCRNNNTKTTSYNAPWADGTKVYIVATFKANYNGTGNPYMKWAVYDATTKARLASNGFTAANALTLSDLSSATFYLGHSQYSSDYDAAATYDEVRLWRLALPDEAIAKSVEFGPDATAEQIAAVETMAVPRTVTVAAGATLDLGGGVLSQPCVNGFGTVQNGTLNVTGVISPGGDGVVGTIAMPGGTVTGEIRIDGGDIVRVVGGGTLDLSAATLTLAGVPTAPFDVAVVADGAAATITGLPAFAVSDGSSLHGWQLRILDGGKRLRVCRKGVMVIVY